MADVGGATYRLDADTADAVAALKAIQSANTRAVSTFDDLDKKVEELTRTIAAASMKIAATGNEVNAYGQKNATSAEQLKKLNGEMAQASGSTARVRKQQKLLNTSLNKTTQAFRAQKGSLTNLSFQLQDVAVQAQMGTNSLIILGQQAPQALATFGPGGAVLGAIIAVGAAMGGVMTSGAESATESIEEMIKRVDELTIAESELLKIKLTDEIAKQSEIFGDASLRSIVLAGNIKSQKKRVDALTKSQGFLNDMFGSSERENLKEYNNELIEATATTDGARREIDRLRDILKQLTDGTLKGADGAKEIKDKFNDLSESLKMNISLVGKSAREQAKLKAVHSLGSKATDEQKEAIRNLVDQLINAESAANTYAKSQVTVKTETKKTENVLASLSSQFEIATTRMQEGEREAFILAQTLKLGTSATKEQSAEVRRLAGDLFDLNKARGLKPVKAEDVSPLARAESDFTTDLDKLKEAHANELIADKEYLDQKLTLEQDYEAQIAAMDEERFRRQSAGHAFVLDSVEALGQASANAISGMLTGTMTAEEAMRSLAHTILNQAIGALVQMGVEQVKQMIIGQSAQTAAAATAAATGATIAAAYAPAAAAVSLATFGANAAPATAALTSTHALSQSLSIGGRQSGGPTNGGGIYDVGEHNQPEVFQTGKGMLMQVPGDGGRMFNKNQLDQINSNDSPKQQPNAIYITQNINGSGDAALAEATRKGAMEGAKIAEKNFIEQISSNDGKMNKALATKFGSGSSRGRIT